MANKIPNKSDSGSYGPDTGILWGARELTGGKIASSGLSLCKRETLTKYET